MRNREHSGTLVSLERSLDLSEVNQRFALVSREVICEAVAADVGPTIPPDRLQKLRETYARRAQFEQEHNVPEEYAIGIRVISALTE